MIFTVNDPPTTEIYTLSLHDALPICPGRERAAPRPGPPGPSTADLRTPRASRAAFRPRRTGRGAAEVRLNPRPRTHRADRSEEHTSELQSQSNLVCRLLLEKKKKREN